MTFVREAEPRTTLRGLRHRHALSQSIQNRVNQLSWSLVHSRDLIKTAQDDNGGIRLQHLFTEAIHQSSDHLSSDEGAGITLQCIPHEPQYQTWKRTHPRHSSSMLRQIFFPAIRPNCCCEVSSARCHPKASRLFGPLSSCTRSRGSLQSGVIVDPCTVHVDNLAGRRSRPHIVKRQEGIDLRTTAHTHICQGRPDLLSYPC